MDKVRVAESRHSRALLFAPRSLFEGVELLRSHLFLREVARVVAERWVVDLHDLREGSRLDLHEEAQAVAVEEVVFERAVRVEVAKEEYALVVLEVVDELADGEHGGLAALLGVGVVPVQILAEAVRAEVAPPHPVWVDHRDYFEDEHVSKQARLWVGLVEQEVDRSFDAEGSRRFSRMHPSCEEYDELGVLEPRLSHRLPPRLRFLRTRVWEESISLQLLALRQYLRIARDREQVDLVAFERPGEQLSLEVDRAGGLEPRAEGIQIDLQVFVAVWVAHREVHRRVLDFGVECEVEVGFCFVHIVDLMRVGLRLSEPAQMFCSNLQIPQFYKQAETSFSAYHASSRPATMGIIRLRSRMQNFTLVPAGIPVTLK